MQKTRLGISVGLMGTIMFLVCLFGGYLAAILVVGYILMFEQNGWLKKMAVRGLALMVVFTFASFLLGLIPDFLRIISNMVSIFEGYFSHSKVDSFFYILDDLLTIFRYVLFILLGLLALKQNTLPLPGIDSIVSKHMD